jgi:hypothetical protein
VSDSKSKSITLLRSSLNVYAADIFNRSRQSLYEAVAQALHVFREL